MKKFLAFFLAAAMIFCLSGCGIPFTAKKIIDDSEIYSKRDIEKAMNQVYCQFALFEGCALLELEYSWNQDYPAQRGEHRQISDSARSPSREGILWGL